jgi:hypothetical protein
MAKLDLVAKATFLTQEQAEVPFPVPPGFFQGIIVLSVTDAHGMPVTGLVKQQVQLSELGNDIVPLEIAFFIECSTLYAELAGLYKLEPDWGRLPVGWKSLVFGITVIDSRSGDRGQTLVCMERAVRSY